MNEWDSLVLRTKIGLEMMEELHQVIVPGGEEAEIFGRELARRTTPEKLAERRSRMESLTDDIPKRLPYSDHPYLAMVKEKHLIRELKARELYTVLDNGSVSVKNLIPKIVDVEQDLHDEKRMTESSINRERWQNVIKKED